jgi:regulator of replication initiation timing
MSEYDKLQFPTRQDMRLEIERLRAELAKEKAEVNKMMGLNATAALDLIKLRAELAEERERVRILEEVEVQYLDVTHRLEEQVASLTKELEVAKP